MLIEVARRLAAGGKVMIAAQHYRVRAQRRAAQNLDLALWPEPQFCDLDRLYLPRLGIELTRELLFDDVKGSLAMDTRVERGGGLDQDSVTFERETATSALFIRASRSDSRIEDRDRARASAYMRGLGDQLFVCGDRIRWDDARLASLGLTAEPLISSSRRTWAQNWAGGDLAAATLAGPSEPGAYLGAQVLAAAFRGRFPSADVEPAFELAATSTSSSPNGELVLIGCSEMFQNRLLAHESYDHAELLLNVVANQSLSPELCESLARRASKVGLGYVDPSARLAWRAWVVCASPFVLLCFGIIWQSRRRLAALET